MINLSVWPSEVGAYFCDSSGTAGALLCFPGRWAGWQSLSGIAGRCKKKALPLLSSEEAAPRCFQQEERESRG